MKKRYIVLCAVAIILSLAAIIVNFIDFTPDNNQQTPPSAIWDDLGIDGIPRPDSNFVFTDEAGHITVLLESIEDLTSYEDLLKSDKAAKLFVQTELVTVFELSDTEIQLIRDDESPRIVICGEDTVVFDIAGFEELPLPEDCRITSVNAENDVQLIIRGLSPEELESYAAELTALGYAESSPAEYSQLGIYNDYSLNGNTISIDYYSNGTDCVISLSKAETGSESSGTPGEVYYDDATGGYYTYGEDGSYIVIDDLDAYFQNGNKPVG